MNRSVTNDGVEEQALIKLYAELTGATEALARGVFMYLSTDGEQKRETVAVNVVQES